ncbi:MAG TPA: hypothetical protein VEA58_00745 [Anaerovoracaceae bacterium]|nr:hypothetical protein [Anaerovoracaceae bacterium]
MKTPVQFPLKIVAVLILILLYVFYNCLRFTYQFFYTLRDANAINPIWHELLQPFIFGFIFVIMIFLIIENKKFIFLVAGISLAVLVFYQPSELTYANTMLVFDSEILAQMNAIVHTIKQIDFLSILNTDYYKKEFSAVMISCIIIYLMKDLKLTYSLTKQRLTAIECFICIFATVYCLYSFQIIPESNMNFYSFMVIFVVVISFLVAKGFTKLILLQNGRDQKMLAFTLIVIPWSLNIFINPYYNYLLNEAVLFVVPIILIGLFTFICYTAERLNQIKDTIIDEES